MTPYSHHRQRCSLVQTLELRRTISIFYCALLILTVLMGSLYLAHAHGGKAHTEKGIDAFEALQTAMDLYDRLLAHGKLDESWETGLIRVEITPPGIDGEGGYTIEFNRSNGDPGSVYFFLTPTGEYAGSNFTGP